MFAWRRLVVGRRVLLSLKSGRGIDGVLVTRRGSLLLLKAARLHELGRDPVKLDGDVIVERPNIEFVQVLPVEEL